MSGMLGKSGLRLGDYVQVGDVKGQLVGGKEGAWTFQPSDSKKSQTTALADKDIKGEGFGNRMSGDYGHLFTEFLGNAVSYGLIQKIRSSPTFGHRFMSFVASDVAYELLLRGFVDRLIPFLRPDSIAVSIGITYADFIDALKTIPVVIIQQIVCKFAYKQKLTGHVLKNLIDAYVAYTVSNLATRNLSGFMNGRNEEKDKSKFLYRY
jgi:hypothetical protein